MELSAIEDHEPIETHFGHSCLLPSINFPTIELYQVPVQASLQLLRRDGVCSPVSIEHCSTKGIVREA
ncbi:MAG: hypothetical protein JW395_1368 [Nitrospira sp.]|nr:hypothetical protein [Nitrospira sp.]